MDRRLNVSLGFNADTRAAKQQIQSLQDQLTALVNSPVGLGEKLTADLVKASHAAAELKVHLKNATNVETGALDFSKLNQSITKSGQSLSSYASQLQKLGPQGQQAFMSLANAVASAEVPLKRSNALLNNFMTTLKNTAKWQLSSSLLHGLQSGVQEAYGYAQDLNESLNNIRIVTGQNIDQMAKFAKEANNAAKALSTTTTEYTNASLIYYQQGLSPQEVKERTDLTIKMANVARVSAEAASDQLTAVWNNFADGTKSLEYYVDVMTALGAKTASSTDEIAGGLEKFAGIANTIGLSYEYATSALATLTSNTRQSEEVVGTALKTIFARIQGLNLGETLEDGVTLNKYSQAMKTVGIDILDQQKNLKSMDTLLDELGNKWNTISKAQQTALAQTVAGTRQYTQLVSLMDNWNKGDEDSFLANLATARGSSGALQEQADIYAESWEAARDRVTAAAEKIYASLFNDEDFIKITNLFADMIDLVGDFTQSIGGLEGVLSGLGLIMTKVFSEQMAQGFRNIAYNIQMSTEAGRKAVQQQKVKVMDEFATMMAGNEASGIGAKAAKDAYSQELQLQTELIANADKMTEAEREKCQYLLEQQKAYGQQTIELARQLELEQQRKSDAATNVYGYGLQGSMDIKTISNRLGGIKEASTWIGQVRAQVEGLSKGTKFTIDDLVKLDTIFDQIGDPEDQNALWELAAQLDGVEVGGKTATKILEQLYGKLSSIAKLNITSFLDASGLDKESPAYTFLAKALDEYAESCENVYVKNNRLEQSQEKLKTSFMSVEEAIKTAKGVTKDWANHLSTMTSSLMSLGMLMSSISGLMDTLKDPNTSGWEKFGQVLTSVSTIAMSFTGIMQGVVAGTKLVKDIFSAETKEKLLNAAASIIQAKAEDKVNDEKKETVKQSRESIKAHKKETREKIKNAASSHLTSGTTKQSDKRKSYEYFRADGKPISKEVYQGALTKQFMTSTVLPTIGYAGAAAAAIALLAVTITGVIAHYQKWNIEAEKAAEAAKMLKDRADQVKTSFDEFTNLSDGYKNAKESLKDLTRGTEEYNKALVESNAQAMELLEKYDSLAGHYTIGQDGLIEIDSAALAAAQAKQLKAVQEAQSAALLGNVVSNNAAYKAKQVDMSRELNSARDNWATVGNAAGGYAIGGLAGAGIGTAIAGGMALGATAGTVVPVIGTLIGLAVGAVAGTVAGVVSTEIAGATAKLETETLEQIAKHYEKNPNIFIDDKAFDEFLRTDLKLKDEPLIRSLVENRKAVEELTKAEKLRAAQEKSDWKAAFNAAAANNDIYAASADKDALANLAYNDVDEKLRSQAADKVDALFSGSNDDFWAKYLETVYGQSGVSIDGAGVTGEDVRVRNLGGGAVTLEKKNADGVWERVGDKNGLDESVARDQLVEAEAQRMAEAAISEYNTTIEDLTAGLVDAGLDSTKDTHKQAIHSILSQFTDKGAIDLTDYAYELVSGMDTDKIGDSNLQSAVEQAKQNYINGLSDLKKEIFDAEWYKALSDKNKEIFWTIDVDQYGSLDNVKKAYDAMQAFLTNNQLTTTIEVADTLISGLKKEGKSKTDWENLKNYYNDDFLKEYSDAMSWDKFMELSQQEQIDYVEAVRSGAIQGSAITNPDAIEQQKNLINDLIEKDKKAQLGAKRYDKYKKLLEDAQKAYDDKSSILRYSVDDILNQEFGSATNSFYDANSIFQFLASDLGLPSIYNSIGTALKEAYQTQDHTAATRAIDSLLAELNIVGTPEGSQLQAALYKAQSGQSLDILSLREIITQLQKPYKQNLDLSKEEADIQRYEKILAHIGDRPDEETSAKKVRDAQDALNTLRQNYQNALDAQEKLFTEMGLGLDDVNNLADVLSSINEELENNEYLANAVAASMLRYSKGITEIAKNYENWFAILENGEELQKSALATELRQVYGDLLNISGESLTYNFLTDEATLELANRATTDTKAYNDLQLAAAMSMGATGISAKNLYTLASDESKAGTSFTWERDNEDARGTQLAYLYTRSYAKAINELEMTDTEAQDLANNIIRALGFEVLEGTFDNGKFTGVTTFGKTAEDSGGVLDPEALKKQKQKKNELDEIERYKAINDQLEELADAYEDVSKAADRLYGNDRLKMLDEQNRLLQNEIDLLTEKRKEIADLNDQQQVVGGYLKTDQDALEAGLKGILGDNIEFKYDQNGVLLNYEDLFTQAHNKASGTAEDDPLREQFAEVLQLIDQFDQTREEWLNNENKILEAQYKIQDNNYTKLTEKLNYDLEITNNELQELDYYLSKAEDDFYKIAEAASHMVDDDGKLAQVGYYQEIYNHQQAHIEALKAAYAAGDISEADYVEGLKEAKDAIYEQLEALTGLDKQMLEYYGNTLAAASEEIGKYTEKMDNLNGVLDHYSSLLKLIGKEKNYDMMAEVLQGSVDVLSDSLDVATKEYEFYSTEAQNKEQAYNDAVDAKADQSVLDLLKKEWEAAEQAQADAQDRMLAKTEQWAEAQKAVIENAMEKAAAALEDALVGKHYSFDFLNEQIDQAVSTQEEYLTTTNKIYETTKLMRTAQQAADVATNATTKQKLKNFITETQQLQDQTDLSKYELEIQQAKYDLLLAEIALQDAQNAKSMVRLKRDSEGNFGYVYTADDNQVADAQQNLEDAENNLYNIALRGAEDYTTKQIELKQEMQEKLKELTTQFRNGEIQDEKEYNERIASMQQYYTEAMESNARLYGVAIDTDNRVVADSWSTTFADLTTDTSQWTTSVTTYLNESATQLENWRGVMAAVTQTVTGDCKNLAGSIEKVTTASEDLRNTLLGSDGKDGVFTKIKSQVDAVSAITKAYNDQRLAIQGLISDYETYAQTVKDDITTAITDGENSSPATNKPNTNPPAPELKKGSKTALSTNATTWANGANIASYAKGATFEILAIEGDRVLLGNPSYNPEGGITGWIKKTDLAGFASGGYTGEWGPSGKLGMLHEKELILNQMDTFNMLTAVDTLHKILEIIDLQSLNASLGGMLSVPGYRDTGSGMLEQNVKIEATFPNVSDHFEIEEAFNTLINQASQYANRK